MSASCYQFSINTDYIGHDKPQSVGRNTVIDGREREHTSANPRRLRVWRSLSKYQRRRKGEEMSFHKSVCNFNFSLHWIWSICGMVNLRFALIFTYFLNFDVLKHSCLTYCFRFVSILSRILFLLTFNLLFSGIIASRYTIYFYQLNTISHNVSIFFWSAHLI